MTTFTTICGLIPMTVGSVKAIDTGYAPLGRAMMGGLLASALLTLVVVPMCCSLLEDLRGWVKNSPLPLSAISTGNDSAERHLRVAEKSGKKPVITGP